MALAEHYYGTGLSDSGPDLAAVLDLMARARPAWQSDALCAEYPGVDFFDTRDTAAAVAICRRCSVAEECAAYARQNGEAAGVWAGVALDPPRRPRANVGRIVSDGAPARLRVAPKPAPVAPKPPPPRKVRKPKSDRTWPRDLGPARPAPASCARCPMAVKKGTTLCKGCEREDP